VPRGLLYLFAAAPLDVDVCGTVRKRPQIVIPRAG